ncbi:sensor histidine kinase [Flaviaesturariibacter terrae]
MKSSNAQTHNTGRHPAAGSSDEALLLLDPQGVITAWSGSAAQLGAEELAGRPYTDLFETRAGRPSAWLDAAATAGKYSGSGRCRRPAGSSFRAWVTLTALQQTGGAAGGYSLSIREENNSDEPGAASERLSRELEQQLQRSRSEIEDYKQALDASSIVAITDQRGIIRFVNENFCAISGYSREELIGQDHRLINSGFHSRDFIRGLWRSIAQGKVWRGELKNRAKDGSYYWVDTTIVPFLDEKRKPYQYVSIRYDITQRKNTEKEFQEVNEQLEQLVRERTLELTASLEREKALNNMKSQFVSMASHEFRTPLSTILSSIGLLELYQGPDQEAKRAKHLEKIKSAVFDLTGILDDFLSLDRLENSRVSIHASRFDLSEFLRDLLEEMSFLAQKKNQYMHLIYEGDEWVWQDRKILRNILLNLLSNALKYSPPETSVWLRATVRNDSMTLSVKDEGIGIPEAAKPLLFGMFYRAENAAHIQGTGLGLNIVRRYVRLLRGHIDFVSSEREGTEFRVRLPLSKET